MQVPKKWKIIFVVEEDVSAMLSAGVDVVSARVIYFSF